MHMMESTLKSIKVMKKYIVSCCVKQSIAACLEYGVMYFQLLKEIQENV